MLGRSGIKNAPNHVCRLKETSRYLSCGVGLPASGIKDVDVFVDVVLKSVKMEGGNVVVEPALQATRLGNFRMQKLGGPPVRSTPPRNGASHMAKDRPRTLSRYRATLT